MKYILTSSKFTGEIVLEYFKENGFLKLYSNNTDMTPEALRSFFERMPVVIDDVFKLKSYSKTLEIKEVKTDLSFNSFWTTYNYKVGNKKRAEKLWNTMSEAEQLQTLTNIPDYEKFLLSKPTQERLYPETYLNQRRFETDYKKLIRK